MLAGLVWMKVAFEEGDDFTLYQYPRIDARTQHGDGWCLGRELRGVLHAAPGVLETLTGCRAATLHATLECALPQSLPTGTTGPAGGAGVAKKRVAAPATIALQDVGRCRVAVVMQGTLPVGFAQVCWHHNSWITPIVSAILGSSISVQAHYITLDHLFVLRCNLMILQSIAAMVLDAIIARCGPACLDDTDPAWRPGAGPTAVPAPLLADLDAVCTAAFYGHLLPVAWPAVLPSCNVELRLVARAAVDGMRFADLLSADGAVSAAAGSRSPSSTATIAEWACVCWRPHGGGTQAYVLAAHPEHAAAEVPTLAGLLARQPCESFVNGTSSSNSSAGTSSKSTTAMASVPPLEIHSSWAAPASMRQGHVTLTARSTQLLERVVVAASQTASGAGVFTVFACVRARHSRAAASPSGSRTGPAHEPLWLPAVRHATRIAADAVAGAAARDGVHESGVECGSTQAATPGVAVRVQCVADEGLARPLYAAGRVCAYDNAVVLCLGRAARCCDKKPECSACWSTVTGGMRDAVARAGALLSDNSCGSEIGLPIVMSEQAHACGARRDECATPRLMLLARRGGTGAAPGIACVCVDEEELAEASAIQADYACEDEGRRERAGGSQSAVQHEPSSIPLQVALEAAFAALT